MSSAFVLEPKNHKIIIDDINGRLKIVNENSILNDQQKIISGRMKSSREALNSAMKNMYNSNFSNDSIQKLSAIAQGKFKEETLLIIAEFSKDYPKSYVSFWYIAMGQMYYGYDIALENAYENLSGEIKKSDVAILFEQKMLMSKMSQTGSTFPWIETK